MKVACAWIRGERERPTTTLQQTVDLLEHEAWVLDVVESWEANCPHV